MSVLEVKNLCASYNNHEAIKDVTFSVEKGEYVCLVGENGSGKSTLIKTIIGLHKKDSGEISINVDDNKIGYVAQNNMRDLSFPATAKEIIMTGVQKHGKLPFYTKKDWEKFEHVCEILNIKSIVGKQIGNLSGGQRQRIILARALIREPELIILDEPCSGLDVNITNEFYKILDKLHHESKITIIMATHDLDEIQTNDVRVVCMATTVKFDGKIEEWKGLDR